MVPFKRIVIASIVAPSVIAGLLFAIAALSWVLMNPATDGDAPFRLAGVGMFAAFPLYGAMVVLCAAVAFCLRAFGALSRRSLLALS